MEEVWLHLSVMFESIGFPLRVDGVRLGFGLNHRREPRVRLQPNCIPYPSRFQHLKVSLSPIGMLRLAYSLPDWLKVSKPTFRLTFAMIGRIFRQSGKLPILHHPLDKRKCNSSAQVAAAQVFGNNPAAEEMAFNLPGWRNW
jgi:hypothetical protein